MCQANVQTIGGFLGIANPANAPITLRNTIFLNNTGGNVGSPITLASGARLTLNADGSYEYDPNDVFDGLAVGATDTDSFTYTVTDPTGATSDATTAMAEIRGSVLVVDRSKRGDRTRLGLPVSALATLWCPPTDPRLIELLEHVRSKGVTVDLERDTSFDPPGAAR